MAVVGPVATSDWVDICPLRRDRNHPIPGFDIATHCGRATIPTPNPPRSLNMTGTSEVRLAGLVAVRTAWITAIVVCALAILIELSSGSGSGDSSRQLPGFAFSDGGDSSPQLPEFASFDPAAPLVGAAAQQDRAGRAKKGAPGKRHSTSGIPRRSGSQPEDTAGRTPVVTPRPKAPQAPGGQPGVAPQAPGSEPTEAPQAPGGYPTEAPQAPGDDPTDTPQAPGGDPTDTPQPPGGDPTDGPQGPGTVTPPMPSKPPKG
jgi:hypothetical protein